MNYLNYILIRILALFYLINLPFIESNLSYSSYEPYIRLKNTKTHLNYQINCLITNIDNLENYIDYHVFV